MLGSMLGLMLVGIGCLAGATQPALAARASGIQVPASLAVTRPLPPPPRGTTALRFEQLFRNPVGPLGLELSDQVKQLDGHHVRMVGFMVAEQPAPRDGFMLAPIPSVISDDDESLADDLPASTILVRLPQATGITIQHVPGLLQLSGTLRVGGPDDHSTNRNATLRLLLDKKTTRALRKLNARIERLRARAS